MISVVVPVYNIASYLDRCIESIVNQSYRSLEIILVDDGSTDGSSEICDRWAKKDKRIKAIHKFNGGVSSARNAGIEVATGQYVSFIDGDDWLETDMYKTLLIDIESNGCDAAFCGVYYAKSENVKSPVSPVRTGVVSGKDACSNILGLDGGVNYQFAAWNKLYKNQHIGAKRFDSALTYGEDGLFSIEVLKDCKKIYLEPMPLYNYFLREGSATHTSGITRQRLDKVRAWQKIRAKLVSDIRLCETAEIFLAEYAIEMTAETYIEGTSEFEEMRAALFIGLPSWSKSDRVSWFSKLKYKFILWCINKEVNPKIVSRMYGVRF